MIQPAGNIAPAKPAATPTPSRVHHPQHRRDSGSPREHDPHTCAQDRSFTYPEIPTQAIAEGITSAPHVVIFSEKEAGEPMDAARAEGSGGGT